MSACNKKETVIRRSLWRNQQLPMLPGRFQPSTFGVYELNYCVRHGYRCRLVAIATELLAEFAFAPSKLYRRSRSPSYSFVLSKLSPRPISTGPLHALRHFHSRPIYLVVYKGSY